MKTTIYVHDEDGLDQALEALGLTPTPRPDLPVAIGDTTIEWVYTNYVRWYNKEMTGHDKVYPSGMPDTCDRCGKEFELTDAIIILGHQPIRHYDCVPAPKPAFYSQIHT